MRSGKQWLEELQIDEPPQLFVGWRPRPRSLTGASIDLHEDTFEVLQSVASYTLQRLSQMESVPYDDSALPVAGEEYLVRSLNDLPTKPAASQDGGSDDTPATSEDDGNEQLADVLALIEGVYDLEVLSAGRLRDGEFTFYGIVFPQADGELVAFVRAVSPTKTLHRAAFFGRHAGSLRRAETPDLLLESDVDMVITGSEVAVLRRSAYDRLFADLDELAAVVPADVAALGALMPKLPLAAGSAEALTSLCTRLPSMAKRLHRLAASGDLSMVSTTTLGDALTNHGEVISDWIDANGAVSLTEDRAKQYLDVLEGRWWTSDFTRERRRADAYRKR